VTLVLVQLLEDLPLIVLVKTDSMMTVAVQYVHHASTHVINVQGQQLLVLNAYRELIEAEHLLVHVMLDITIMERYVKFVTTLSVPHAL